MLLIVVVVAAVVVVVSVIFDNDAMNSQHVCFQKVLVAQLLATHLTRHSRVVLVLHDVIVDVVVVDVVVVAVVAVVVVVVVVYEVVVLYKTFIGYQFSVIW